MRFGMGVAHSPSNGTWGLQNLNRCAQGPWDLQSDEYYNYLQLYIMNQLSGHIITIQVMP